MARGASGKSVRTITHEKSGESAVIRLDSHAMVFHCEIGGDRFSDKDGEKVAAWAAARLETHAALHWTAAIEIFIYEDDRHVYGVNAAEAADLDEFEDANDEARLHVADVGAANCMFAFRRFYFAKAASGWREVRWLNYREHDATATMNASHSMRIGIRTGYSDGSTGLKDFNGVLPYSDRGVDPWGEIKASDEMRMLLPYDEATWQGVSAIAGAVQTARARLVEIAGDARRLQEIAARLPLQIPAGT